MTDDLRQARIEAALNGFYETEHKQAGWARPFVRTAGLENWSPQSIARMEAALAAADAYLPSVEQIAEVIMRALVFTNENSKPWADGVARDVRALLGEVTRDE